MGEAQADEAPPIDPGWGVGTMYRNPSTGTIWFWDGKKWIRGNA